MARRKLLVSLAFACVVSVGSLLAQNQTAAEAPRAFGTSDYTVTSISATGFVPATSDTVYFTTGSWGRQFALNTVTELFASPDIPAGAVIDFIGINSNTDTAAAFTAELRHRDAAGILSSPIGSVDTTPHSGWGMDLNAAPLNYVWQGTSGEVLITRVLSASLPTLQFFGAMEIWWKRSVSPAPATASFTDVPTDHQFFQFIEALKASGITGGCGPGIYCPDAPVTRGQMATFLAKALGLHWAGAPGTPAAHQ